MRGCHALIFSAWTFVNFPGFNSCFCHVFLEQIAQHIKPGDEDNIIIDVMPYKMQTPKGKCGFPENYAWWNA